MNIKGIYENMIYTFNRREKQEKCRGWDARAVHALCFQRVRHRLKTSNDWNYANPLRAPRNHSVNITALCFPRFDLTAESIQRCYFRRRWFPRLRVIGEIIRGYTITMFSADLRHSWKHLVTETMRIPFGDSHTRWFQRITELVETIVWLRRGWDVRAARWGPLACGALATLGCTDSGALPKSGEYTHYVFSEFNNWLKSSSACIFALDDFPTLPSLGKS